MIIGVNVPQVLQFPTTNSTREIIWDVDIEAGSSVILQGYDTVSAQAIGRSSGWMTVGANANGDESCVNTANGGGGTTTSPSAPVRSVTTTMMVSPKSR